MRQQELLAELIKAIGERIAGIGEAIENEGFAGLAQRLEDLRACISSAEAAERMRKL